MAQRFTLDHFGVAFESNVIASTYGEHIWNLLTAADIENGCIVGRGAYVTGPDGEDIDLYELAAAPTGFEFTVRRQMNNGNWLVEVTKLPANADVILLRQVPIRQYDYDEEFKKEDTFYNKAGDIVRGLTLHFGDRFEVSAECFNDAGKKIAAGKVITSCTNYKMNIPQ